MITAHGVYPHADSMSNMSVRQLHAYHDFQHGITGAAPFKRGRSGPDQSARDFMAAASMGQFPPHVRNAVPTVSREGTSRSLPTFNQTNKGESPNPLQRRFKQMSPSGEAARARSEAKPGKPIPAGVKEFPESTAAESKLPVRGPNAHPFYKTPGSIKKSGSGYMAHSRNGGLEHFSGANARSRAGKFADSGGTKPNFSTGLPKQNTQGTAERHSALLAARKAARARYPAGHPTRVAAERAVRQSRKVGGGNTQASQQYKKARGG